MEMSTLVPIGAWAWEKYGKSVIDRAASGLKRRWERIKWIDAAEKYREKIRRLYGSMQVMGMHNPIPLDDIFTDVFVLDRPTAFSRFDIDTMRLRPVDAPAFSVTRTNGLALVGERILRRRSASHIRALVDQKGENLDERELTTKTGRNLFILGKPGAGKTTFLKYIAVKAAEQVIDRVPIFISLKQWADSEKDLLPFITERFDICDFPEANPFVVQLLNSGNAIVLFDGLDEVSQESGQRDKQITQMNAFVEKFDRTQCLITCRIAATDYSFTPFTYVELADFTPKQIRTFVGNWFRDAQGKKDKRICQLFLAEFDRDDNVGLRDLAKTPLLLTLLCLAFDETLSFPQRRVEIYEEALDALLKKWDASRRIKRDFVYRKLSLGHKQTMLKRIAAQTFESNQYFIPQADLEKSITAYVENVPPHDANEQANAETILRSIEAQHGILVERARGIYSFSHLTFHEYFTAKYIVDNSSRGTFQRLIELHCSDARWREIFLLTTSLLPDATDFINAFRSRLDGLLANDDQLIKLLGSIGRKTPAPEKQHGDLFVLHEWRARLLNQALERSRDQTVENALAQALRDAAHAQSSIADLQLIEDRATELGFEVIAREIGVLVNSLKREVKFAPEMTNGLRSLIAKYKVLEIGWRLSARQYSHLLTYIATTRLLMNCLDLATMPPVEKERILSSLYLPHFESANPVSEN